MAGSTTGRPVSLADVARHAGVSVPTASRVLNGGVRGENSGRRASRNRVLASAEELGYAASPAAQATQSGRARMVGLVITDIGDFGAATLTAGVMRAAEKRGLSVAVRTTLDDPTREIELLTRLRGERPAAVILATARSTDPDHEREVAEQLGVLREQGARVALIGSSDLDFPRVTVDNREGAAALASLLVRTGRRRFAVVAGPADQVTSRDRAEGFVAGLAEQGVAVPDDLLLHMPFSREGGHAAAARLAPHAGDLELVAAMSDTMAVGLIAGLREHGVRVPEDLEVTGFDRVPLLGDVLPDFATVEIPLEELGEAALAVALDHEDDDEPHRAMTVHTIVGGQRRPVRTSTSPS